MKIGYLAVALLLLGGCASAVQPTPSTDHPRPSPSPSHSTTARRHASTSTPSAPVATRASTWPKPDDVLTPGAVVQCTLPRPQSQRNVTAAERSAIATAYHYVGRRGLAYLEFDHRVPFALCGANDARNVWPERADGVHQSAFVHNRKDQLESVVTRYVREGKLTLTQAQAIFMGDWRTAWCVYVHSPEVNCS